MQIRLARIDDSQTLAHIQVDSFRTTYATILPKSYLDHFSYAEQTQDWQDWFSAGRGEILCVAETDSGEVVGYALGKAGPTTITGYDSELVALHVRKAYRRQGAGRLLMSAIAGHLRSGGSASLMLWVLAENPARGFYERLSGLPIGEGKTAIDESDFRAVKVAYGWPDIHTLCS